MKGKAAAAQALELITIPQSAKTQTHTTHPAPHNRISLTHLRD